MLIIHAPISNAKCLLHTQLQKITLNLLSATNVRSIPTTYYRPPFVINIFRHCYLGAIPNILMIHVPISTHNACDLHHNKKHLLEFFCHQATFGQIAPIPVTSFFQCYLEALLCLWYNPYSHNLCINFLRRIIVTDTATNKYSPRVSVIRLRPVSSHHSLCVTCCHW